MHGSIAVWGKVLVYGAAVVYGGSVSAWINYCMGQSVSVWGSGSVWIKC